MSCDVGKAMEGLENELDITSTSQPILQPFLCFTYITAHSPTLPLLHLHNSSFSNHSIASPTSQLILQPFHYFIVTTHSLALPSLFLHHSPFSNHSVASPSSHLILQPFFCFSYITGPSFTSPGELSMYSSHENWDFWV